MLVNPKNALMKQYCKTFTLSGVPLHTTEAALHAIAGRARKRGTGARGLRSLLESLLRDAMFEVCMEKVDPVTSSAACIRSEECRRWLCQKERNRR